MATLWLKIIHSRSTSRKTPRAVVSVRVVAVRSFRRTAPFINPAQIPRGRFRFGSVSDVVMKKLPNERNRLARPATKQLKWIQL